MEITLPSSLLSLLPKYNKVVVNCTSPELREISAKIHMTLLPLIDTIAILHTPYQPCSPMTYQQFKKDEKTLIVQVGGICGNHEDVYIYPLDIPFIKSIEDINDKTVVVCDPSLIDHYALLSKLNKQYLVLNIKDAYKVREEAIKNGVNEVVILKVTETFNTFPFQLYFSPMKIVINDLVANEKKDVTNETMRYVMNRYSIFDKIAAADSIMMLLLDPEWCLSVSLL